MTVNQATDHIMGCRIRPQVSIVIPVFNRWDLTEQCLVSLTRTLPGIGLAGSAGSGGCAGSGGVEVIVVDNGSRDATAAALARDWPWVGTVSHATNLGFARGCNAGVARSTAPLVVLLNNGTEARPGWLAPLLDALSDPTVGVVAPKLLFPDGTIQHAGMALMEHRHRAHSGATANLNALHLHSRAAADHAEANRPRDLQLVTGAVLALRRATFDQLGGFDEGYWNGCEDVELCLRAAEAGYRVRYEPASVLVHRESASGAERWTKVSDNLQRLTERWCGRVVADVVVTAEGWLIPTAGWSPAGWSPPSRPAPRTVPMGTVESGGKDTVIIEGAVFAYHSLSQINRELAVRLASDHQFSVLAASNTFPQLSAAEDPRLLPVVETALAPPAPAPEHTLRSGRRVIIRHQWPPNWEVPAGDAPVVVIQPWEFGGLPDEWVIPLCQWPDEIWCYTTWVRDCYLRSGVPADRLVVMAPGVDLQRFAPGGEHYPLRTTKAHRLLFVGGPIHRKGFDLLLEGYRQAFSSGDDVCLVLKTFGTDSVYKGADPGKMVAEFTSQPHAPAVELITEDLNQGQMAALYRSCHTLVHPYRGEGFGLPVAEAMASGLAVVVTADGATADFCDEHNAYLLPSRRVSLDPATVGLGPSRTGYWLAEPDVAALVSTLRSVIADPARHARLAAAGRARVTEQLEWGQVAARAAGRLTVLLERSARRSALNNTDRYPLDGVRSRVLLAVIDPAAPNDPAPQDDGHVERLLGPALEVLGDNHDITLVVALRAAPQRMTDAAIRRLEALMEGRDADVMALTDIDNGAVAALIARCDAMIRSNRSESSDTVHGGVRVVTDTADIRRWIGSAAPANRYSSPYCLPPTNPLESAA